MNLSDRIGSLFGLENEPHCTIRLNLESGELDINCATAGICYSVKKRLDQLLEGGVALDIPYININHDGKQAYHFQPALLWDYGIRWNEANPGLERKMQLEAIHRTKLYIMSQMGIDVESLIFSSELKEKWQCSDES